MTDKQPEALRLADILQHKIPSIECLEIAAAELRRLHEAHDWQYKMAGDRLRRIEKLERMNVELVEALWAMLSEGADYGMSHDNSAYEQAHAAIAKTAGVNHDR